MLQSPDDVIAYWFGATIHGSLESIQERMKIWFFRSSPEFDAVQVANKALIEQLAVDPHSAGWQVDEDPKALLAVIILLDQFSRSVFRGTPQAFASDELCADLIDRIALRSPSFPKEEPAANVLAGSWFLERYSPIERFFLCVALQHSEKLSHQTTGIHIASLVGHGASDDIIHYFANLKGFPMEHHDVIQRFGRFPHRNVILVRCALWLFGSCVLMMLKHMIACTLSIQGRATTDEETQWLHSDECPGWAKSQQPAPTTTSTASTV
jgi:uncharacterized protein (DUF924 family)